MKIRTQLLVFVLSVVLVGFAAVMLISYHSSKRAVVSEIFEKAEHIKKRHQEYLNGFFLSAGKIAWGVAQAIRADDKMSEDKVHGLLRENITWNPEVYGMTVLFEPKPNEKGKKLFAPYYFRHGQLLKYIPARPTFNYEEQDWYSQPKQQAKSVWTEPYFDKGAKAVMTTYAVPIYRGKDFIGVATVDIDLKDLAKKIESIQIGKNGYAILVSRNGTFLAHPERESVLNKNLRDIAEEESDPAFGDLADRMIKGKSGAMSLMDPITHRESWVTYGPIPSVGYSLAVFIPESELLLSVNELGRTILFVSIIVTALIAAAIIALSWRITSPIRALSESAREITGGNLQAKIRGSESKGEIGGLTRDIKSMVETIKSMLATVQEEKEKFERVFTTMSDGIVAADPNWKILGFNRAAERMLGIEEGEHLIERIMKDFHANFELKEFLDYKKRVRQFDIVRPETDQVGEMVFQAMINAIVDADDRITSYVLTVRNVTEDRREEMNKGNLLSMISHKIRTPITVLRGTVSLFEDGVLGELNEKQAANVKKLAAHSEKLQDLVDRLIGYVAVVGGEKGEKETVDVREFLTRMIEGRKWEYDGRVPTIVLDIDVDGPMIVCNREHLRLIISELIENATRFNRSDEVKIAISFKREGQNFVLRVSDNGIGIASIHHDRIFERFFQVDKYFTGNVEGVGLGLSLVKAFIDQYGGSIRVDSKEGEGTTFTIEIPAKKV